MLRYLYQDQLDQFPILRDSMFRDRAIQFRDRLGWTVTVNAHGWEQDQYDALNALYVIWQRSDGTHGGSMRFMPTLGPTMVNEHFRHLTNGVLIADPRIWECTRFCLAPHADPHIPAALMLAGGEVMRGRGLTHLVGVFDARMVRIYRAIGASPVILGSAGMGATQISVGLWQFSEPDQVRVSRRAGISPALSRHWYQRAFGGGRPVLQVG